MLSKLSLFKSFPLILLCSFVGSCSNESEGLATIERTGDLITSLTSEYNAVQDHILFHNSINRSKYIADIDVLTDELKFCYKSGMSDACIALFYDLGAIQMLLTIDVPRSMASKSQYERLFFKAINDANSQLQMLKDVMHEGTRTGPGVGFAPYGHN